MSIQVCMSIQENKYVWHACMCGCVGVYGSENKDIVIGGIHSCMVCVCWRETYLFGKGKKEVGGVQASRQQQRMSLPAVCKKTTKHSMSNERRDFLKFLVNFFVVSLASLGVCDCLCDCVWVDVKHHSRNSPKWKVVWVQPNTPDNYMEQNTLDMEKYLPCFADEWWKVQKISPSMSEKKV